MKIPIFYRVALVLAAACLMHDVHAKKVTSKTHFSTRPQFQSASPEFISGCRYDKNVTKKSSWGGHFQAVLFGGASTESDDFGTYFMPFGSPSAKVSEVLVADASTTLHAEHFNILSLRAEAGMLHIMRTNAVADTFKSTISLHPREWSVGLGLHYQHLFNKQSNHPFYLSISTPILHVESDVRLQEVIINEGGGVAAQIPGVQPLFGNMKDALHQEAWLYGKIDNHAHHKTGFGDIETKLGFVVAQTESIVFDLSLGLIIPTSNKQKNHFMFEPQLGNGQHVGLLGGGTFRVVLSEDDAAHWNFSYEAALTAQYLFENTQKRSFDLINKPWSRYLEMYESLAQATAAGIAGANVRNLISTPGINILTQDMKVEPGFNVTWNNAFVLNCCSWEFEAGYNLHAREAESVKLKNQWVESAAVKKANGQGVTNSRRDITANRTLNDGAFGDGAVYIPIKATDLDLKSAAHPSVVSHTVYGAAGYRWTTCKWPFGVTYGGSYEFPSDGNKSLSRWTMWLKADISF
ncbi:hypothetical protein JST56_05125 [Candidatus Dependentiae bacterium]|nr:hypothetical protein [Candidatus Dependentiae bacterium]